MKNYVDCPPKTPSDRIEFVKNNAPKIVDGLKMIEKYLNDLKNKTNSKLTKPGINPEKITVP